MSRFGVCDPLVTTPVQSRTHQSPGITTPGWSFSMVTEMVKVYTGASGKMDGIPHISVAPGESPVCKECKMAKSCYAQRIHPTPRESYRKNGNVLTSHIIVSADLPYVHGGCCRLNAFGELYTGNKGKIQLTNYVNICEKNPGVTFVLWTRNYSLIENYFSGNPKPGNLKLMRSSPDFNVISEEIYGVWDGVFNVVTRDYARDNGVSINCGIKDSDGKKIPCFRCPTGCYRKETHPVCYEIKK